MDKDVSATESEGDESDGKDSVSSGATALEEKTKRKLK